MHKGDQELTLSSEDGQKKGCFFTAAAASVGEIELKWRLLRSGSPVLAIKTPHKNPRIANKKDKSKLFSHIRLSGWARNSNTNPNQSPNEKTLKRSITKEANTWIAFNRDEFSIAQVPRNPNLTGLLPIQPNS